MDIQNEVKVKDGENLTLGKSKKLNDKAEKSVCQVITDHGSGSGFICKIKILQNGKIEEIYCLITNNHVLNENDLEKDFITITFYSLKNKDNQLQSEKLEKQISLNLDRKIWTNEEIDYTCVEILEQDNIFQNINIFEIDDSCYNMNYDVKKYDKKGLVIASIGPKEEIELGQGAIEYRNKYKHKFFHNCNTVPGYSGGAAILVDNLKIIGIHKGWDRKNKNVGIYMKEILNDINNQIKNKKNEIQGILDIEKRELIIKKILLYLNIQKTLLMN